MEPDLTLWIAIIFLVLCALTALIVLIAARFTYAKTFMRKLRDYDPRHGLDKPGFIEHKDSLDRIFDRITDEPCQIISITARDGIKLYARYYKRREGAPIHLICHGYKSSPIRDGSGGGCDAIDLGHNALLIYQRAHGMSEGETISFGVNERLDILDWTRYLTELEGDGCEIILIGVSMGAASVIMASELELPKTVKCIIADCPYAVPKDIILDAAAKMGFPPKLAYPFIKLGARIYGGFDLEGASATEAIKNARVPILIAHGESDSIVPVEMARELARAASDAGHDCTLMTFPGAEHCMSFIANYEIYTEKRNAFLRKHIKNFDCVER